MYLTVYVVQYYLKLKKKKKKKKKKKRRGNIIKIIYIFN
jgi:hypothetical protein